MAYRNILIENPAKISVKNRQLIINTGEFHSVPIEDISTLLIENNQSTITSAALSALGASGCTVFFCDEKHMPCAVLSPYHQHSRELLTIKMQLDASTSLNKNLWKQIVIAKITNQAKCLMYCGKEGSAERLKTISTQIRSGDPDNREASAAQIYFSELFGSGFSRHSYSGTNAGLNYGYAILRGCIARNLASYGFLPTVGIHHHGSLNSFNLADDIIEPFRPIIDMHVFLNNSDNDILNTNNKRDLYNCLNLEVLVKEQIHSVSYSIELMIQSLKKSFEEKSSLLTPPLLLPQKQHIYE